jgi:methylenetetrahydrofolate dehydrogenase (NADP+) / methenyltetrahydrofolate cyclohydrolase
MRADQIIGISFTKISGFNKLSTLSINVGEKSSKFLYGKPVVDQIYQRVSQNVGEKKKITLAILATDYRTDTEIYLNKKIRALSKFGFLHILKKETEEEKQKETILQWNSDPEIDGVLIQLPLGPNHPSELINLLKSEKDVDGLKQSNPFFKSCTASAIWELIQFYKIPIMEKEIVVIGKGQVVGIPITLLLLEAGGTLTVVHKSTKDIESHLKRADILISGAGCPDLIHSKNIKSGSILIDAGINRRDNKIKGDVALTDELLEKVSFVSPVPGGIGPITVAKLLENLSLAGKIKK